MKEAMDSMTVAKMATVEEEHNKMINTFNVHVGRKNG